MKNLRFGTIPRCVVLLAGLASGCTTSPTGMSACGMAGAACTSTADCCAAFGCFAGQCAAPPTPDMSTSPDLACPVGFGDCNNDPNDGCEAHLQSDVKNCGACGHACEQFPNRATSCVNGTCVPGACTAPYADCDAVAANGCEVDTSKDPKNCGGCAQSCTGANSAQSCAMGACAITSCTAGFADCDGQPGDGCETAIASDAANCGGCGKTCNPANATAACANGSCAVATCNFGFADCNKNPADGCEVDLRSAMNCGTCGNVCAAPPHATPGCTNAGMCGIGMCNPMWGDCDKNPANGCEQSLGNDVNNCGACGNVCAVANAMPACLGGQCGLAMCNAGFADCDMKPANGCEVNVQMDANNCGKCGSVCNPNTSMCVAGACKLNDGQPCNVGSDCVRGVCAGGICAPPPVLTSISPASGPTTGGIALTLDGANFLQGATITVAGIDAAGVWVSPTRMTATLPAKPGTLGKVAVTVTNPGGQTVTRSDLFSYYAGTTAFAAKVDYTPAPPSANGGPMWVGLGDVNGDKNLDIVVANSGGGNVGLNVLLNAGKGIFGMAATYAAGDQPWSGALGDLNGDGKLDVAVPNAGGNSTTATVVLNAGNGTFGAPSSYTAGTNPHGCAIGDLNGDGHADLVVTNIYGASVAVLLNNGNGTLGAAVGYGVGQWPNGVAIGDVNGDGKADIVTSNVQGNNVSVLLNSGKGAFAAAANYGIGNNPITVILGDFNGDGALDIAASPANDNTASVLLNNGNGFAAVVAYPVGNHPVSIATGDLNGDGKADLVTVNFNDNSLSALMGKGDGTFGAAATFTVGSGPSSVAIGDVNGDILADLVVTNGTSNTVSVLLNISH